MTDSELHSDGETPTAGGEMGAAKPALTPADSAQTVPESAGTPPESAQTAPEASPGARGGGRGRAIALHVLVVVTSVLGVVGMLSVWANRLVFNPDNWESTSTQLLANSDIRNATSNYLVDQLYANVNVPGVIKSGLPPRLQPLAGPVAGALRNVAVDGVNLALQRPLIQTLWAKANRAADQTLITIVNGGSGSVAINHGVVTLDLASIANAVASRLGISANIGAKLPPSVAHLVVFRSSRLSFIQNVGSAVEGLALLLTILVPLLYAIATALARNRQRMLMEVGFAIVIVGLIGVAGRHLLQTQIVDSIVTNAANRPAAAAVMAIGTELLSVIAIAFIIVGLVLVVAAWFAGPTRPAVALRRLIAPFIERHPGPTYGIVVSLMLLIFIWQPIPATGTPVGIVVFLALVLLGAEVLRRQVAVEFPPGAAARVAPIAGGSGEGPAVNGEPTLRLPRLKRQAPASTGPTLPEQLERLVDLRDRGAITPDEYETAKSSLLSG